MFSFSIIITTLAILAIVLIVWHLVLTYRSRQSIQSILTQAEHKQQMVLELEQRLQQSLFLQQQAQTELRVTLVEQLHHQLETVQTRLHEAAQAQQSSKLEHLQLLQSHMLQSFTDLRQQLSDSMQQGAQTLNQRMSELTQITEQRLQSITQQVEQRLQTGFEQSTATFTQIVERLTMIDAAQQKITELSANVVSLQDVLLDKRARGAFGEVQLATLIQNLLPPTGYSLQATLSNDKRVDCLLKLPEPSGHMAIDAKFPLETYRLLQEATTQEQEIKTLSQQFRQDLKKHIKDIASKYIVPGETADSAMMFIPAEAIFSDIHAKFADVIDFAHQQRVWLVSPTTMMAVLTTARAVIKDAATRQQVPVIQTHLRELSSDFGRFRTRMDKLATHIAQAHQDVAEVNTSANKIGQRFDKIESVELLDTLAAVETN